MISVCKQNYEYDKANQLVNSTDATGKITNYDYDAAGRLTKEGDKSYVYGWLDKVVNVSENGKLSASFEYGVDNQLSSRTDATGKSENFTWDGLALIKRDATNFVNESAVTGGNPILAFGKYSSKVLFEDMLGSTVGSVEGGKFNAINRDAFGELESGDSSVDFFTGKPQVKELGYAFLFRNYRAEQGKWQTADPIGYPDGWNNLAYVNNMVTSCIDWLGAQLISETYESVTIDGYTGEKHVIMTWNKVGEEPNWGPWQVMRSWSYVSGSYLDTWQECMSTATTYTEFWQLQRSTYIIFPTSAQVSLDSVNLYGQFQPGSVTVTMNKFDIEDHVAIGSPDNISCNYMISRTKTYTFFTSTLIE